LRDLWRPRRPQLPEAEVIPFPADAEAIPQGRLYVGKDQTHGLERDHARQRHWLARFRRRSIVVSKAQHPAAPPPPRRGIGPQARWSTPRSRCSLASAATTGSANLHLC
jgi:hypothetical protein